MLASLSSFRFKGPSEPYHQVANGVRTLEQLDGTPGDKNKHPNAISMETRSGRLDAVVLSNDNNTQTIVQRLTEKSGKTRTSWVELPAKGNGVPDLEGFEISASGERLSGINLEVENHYTDGGFLPSRKYDIVYMNGSEAQNSLMRADSVLAAFEM